jgi:hypothetical protein
MFHRIRFVVAAAAAVVVAGVIVWRVRDGAVGHIAADVRSVKDDAGRRQLEVPRAILAAAPADAGDVDGIPADWPVEHSPVCIAFAQAEIARLRALIADSGEGAPDAALPFGVVRCASGVGGAWGSFIDDATIGAMANGIQVSGPFRVVHLDAKGNRVVRDVADAAPGEEFRVEYDAAGIGNHADIEVLSDYDHDGVSEVLVRLEPMAGDNNHIEIISIETLKDGRIVRYAPADGFPIKGLEDVDGDGRRDIVFGVGQVSTIAGCIGSHPLDAIDWVAHSTPKGDFDPADEVAMKHARAECATSSGPIVRRTGGVVDVGVAAEGIVCGLLHGRSRDAIHAEIRKGCDTFPSEITQCSPEDKVDPRACPDWFLTLPDVALPARPDAGDGG